MYKVIGLRVEKYLGTTCTGHNCDFEYEQEERDSHVLLLKGQLGDYKELTLKYEEGECGSGWCTASYGEFTVKDVETFAGKTHKPAGEFLVDLDKLESTGLEDTYSCDVFTFSETGYDSYYPSGSYEVNMELFRLITEDE